MEKVQVRINLTVRCPECHLQWAYSKDAKTLSCLNAECSFFGRRFSVPMINLDEIKQDDEIDVSLGNPSVALWIDGSQLWGISSNAP